MRVDIKGDMPITGENIKWVIDNLNEEYEKLGVKGQYIIYISK